MPQTCESCESYEPCGVNPVIPVNCVYHVKTRVSCAQLTKPVSLVSLVNRMNRAHPVNPVIPIVQGLMPLVPRGLLCTGARCPIQPDSSLLTFHDG